MGRRSRGRSRASLFAFALSSLSPSDLLSVLVLSTFDEDNYLVGFLPWI